MKGRLLHPESDVLLQRGPPTDRPGVLEADGEEVAHLSPVPGEVLLGDPAWRLEGDGRVMCRDGDRFAVPHDSDLDATDEFVPSVVTVRKDVVIASAGVGDRPVPAGDPIMPTWSPQSAGDLPRSTGLETLLSVLMWVVIGLTTVAQLAGLYLFAMAADWCTFLWVDEECVADTRRGFVWFEVGIGVAILTALTLARARWRIKRRRRTASGYSARR